MSVEFGVCLCACTQIHCMDAESVYVCMYVCMCMMPVPQPQALVVDSRHRLPRRAKKGHYDLSSLPDFCNVSLNAHRLMHDNDDNDGFSVLLHLRMIMARKRGIFKTHYVNKNNNMSSPLSFKRVQRLFVHARPLCWGVITEWVEVFFY